MSFLHNRCNKICVQLFFDFYLVWNEPLLFNESFYLKISLILIILPFFAQILSSHRITFLALNRHWSYFQLITQLDLFLLKNDFNHYLFLLLYVCFDTDAVLWFSPPRRRSHYPAVAATTPPSQSLPRLRRHHPTVAVPTPPSPSPPRRRRHYPAVAVVTTPPSPPCRRRHHPAVTILSSPSSPRRHHPAVAVITSPSPPRRRWHSPAVAVTTSPSLPRRHHPAVADTIPPSPPCRRRHHPAVADITPLLPSLPRRRRRHYPAVAATGPRVAASLITGGLTLALTGLLRWIEYSSCPATDINNAQFNV